MMAPSKAEEKLTELKQVVPDLKPRVIQLREDFRRLNLEIQQLTDVDQAGNEEEIKQKETERNGIKKTFL